MGQSGESESNGQWCESPASDDAEGEPGQDGEDGGGDGQAKEDGKEKEAPSPDGTILITTYGKYGGVKAGDHSALLIKGKGYFLFDPAGSYRNGSRPSNDIFYLSEAGFSDYLQFHKADGSEIVLTKIGTTPSQEDEIVKRAEAMGGVVGGFCAHAVSNALGGVCGISGSDTPDGLRRQAEGAKCGK